jgi:hypothetical protein
MVDTITTAITAYMSTEPTRTANLFSIVLPGGNKGTKASTADGHLSNVAFNVDILLSSWERL